jgi:4-amino-4-deoxychorismate lyase
MTIQIIDENNFIEKIKSRKFFSHEEYYAFYSSWLGGIVKNPGMMLLPIDDHMVHRGDGIFEAMKVVHRAVYLMQEHLERLFISANKISLNLSFDINHVKEVILETLRVANQDNAIVRVFISRGPGNFSVNPYDPIEPQLYIVITSLKSPAPEKYSKGVVIGKSEIPMKSSWMVQIKSCNYLPNVLMKKEAIDRGFDFVIGIDSEGMITEGSTENIMIVDQNETIIHPPLTHILKGTTMIRACELARENGMKTEIKSISLNDLISAREVMITGTSLNVLPVVQFEDHVIGSHQPGIIAKRLNQLIIEDIESGKCSVAF